MKNPSDLPDNLQDTYAALMGMAEADDVHDLIAKEGLSVLKHPIPYLAQRLRWRGIDRARRDNRAIPTDNEYDFERSLDPAREPSLNLDVADAFAKMDQADVWLLWWAAAGHPTKELVHLWKSAGFEPADPREDYLRKRLSLARTKLKKLLG